MCVFAVCLPQNVILSARGRVPVRQPQCVLPQPHILDPGLHAARRYVGGWVGMRLWLARCCWCGVVWCGVVWCLGFAQVRINSIRHFLTWCTDTVSSMCVLLCIWQMQCMYFLTILVFFHLSFTDLYYYCLFCCFLVSDMTTDVTTDLVLFRYDWLGLQVLVHCHTSRRSGM